MILITALQIYRGWPGPLLLTDDRNNTSASQQGPKNNQQIDSNRLPYDPTHVAACLTALGRSAVRHPRRAQPHLASQACPAVPVVSLARRLTAARDVVHAVGLVLSVSKHRDD